MNLNGMGIRTRSIYTFNYAFYFIISLSLVLFLSPSCLRLQALSGLTFTARRAGNVTVLERLAAEAEQAQNSLAICNLVSFSRARAHKCHNSSLGSISH